MKKVKPYLLIITGLLILTGGILRQYPNYTLVAEILVITALCTAIISALLGNSKVKRLYLIIIILLASLFLLYPVLFK